jgi:hypothetical protein
MVNFRCRWTVNLYRRVTHIAPHVAEGNRREPVISSVAGRQLVCFSLDF